VSENRSGMAVGFTFFASVMMIMIGIFHSIAGFTAIVHDAFFTTPAEYLFDWNPSAWGWIHLILGIVVLLAGFGLLSGAVWARTVGVFMAVVSAVVSFAWIPYYPVWSIILIAIAVTVIWALTAHGRDMVE
jgi:hypothetical protein